LLSRALFLAQLQKVRRDGLSTSIGERMPGTVSIAVPGVTTDGEAVAAVSLAWPAQRHTQLGLGVITFAPLSGGILTGKHPAWRDAPGRFTCRPHAASPAPAHRRAYARGGIPGRDRARTRPNAESAGARLGVRPARSGHRHRWCVATRASRGERAGRNMDAQS